MSHKQCPACYMLNIIMPNMLGYIIIQDDKTLDCKFIHKGEYSPDERYKPDLTHVKLYELLAHNMHTLLHLTLRLSNELAETENEDTKNLLREVIKDNIYKSGFMMEMLKVAIDTNDDELFKFIEKVPY